MEKFDLILRLLEDFRDETMRRFEQIDKRFEQMDKRFEQIDKRFAQMEKQFDGVRVEIREDRQKLDKVYEARERVKVTFGWQWGMISLLIAIIAAGIAGAVR